MGEGSMAMEAWGERLTPAFGDTVRRFPFPIVLIVITTALALVLSNRPVFLADTEVWSRAFGGFAIAAIFATAGVFYAEARPQSRFALVLIYLVPAVVGVLCQIRDTTWFVPYALPMIGVLWLSISAFVGMPREEAEPRFWWFNHRAIASAAIAGIALVIIGVGIAAIERTLAMLFGLNASTLSYRFVLPVIGVFLAPLYWLSTLPRPSDYDARVLVAPDFLARAVGLVGKFVLIPLLLAYTAILFAYGLQIAITRTLPQGTLGWMVLSFVTAGAGTILVLYPPFVRDSRIVRFFIGAWFWLTIPPLVLFFIAVWVRIDAYGFTTERVILSWGGIWAALLTLFFLLGRRDIRLIPGLAAVVLLVATFGPWNVDNLPRLQQGITLDALLTRPGANGVSAPSIPDWNGEDRARAVGAITYLAQSREGRAELVSVLRGHGHEFDAATVNSVSVMSALALNPDAPAGVVTAFTLSRDIKGQPVDVSATPYFIAQIRSDNGARIEVGDVRIDPSGDKLWMSTLSKDPAFLNATAVDVPQLKQPNGGILLQPTIDFSFAGTTYRIVVDDLGFTRTEGEPEAITRIGGTLFADRPPPAALSSP